MRVSFGHGFVKIPSKNISFNPDNVVMIHPNGDKNTCSVEMTGYSNIPFINASPEEVTKSCVLARQLGESVEITENNRLNLSA